MLMVMAGPANEPCIMYNITAVYKVYRGLCVMCNITAVYKYIKY